MKIGDAISKVATPIAGALGSDCFDPVTHDLRPESPCAKRRDALNNFSDAIYDRFWRKSNHMDNQDAKEFLVNVAVKAKNIKEALAKIPDAEGVDVLAINPRQSRSPQSVGTSPARVVGSQFQKTQTTPN